MRLRLKQAGSDLSPEAALAKLRRIQRHTIAIDASTPITGVSTVDKTQAGVPAALKLRKPNQTHQQMSML